MTEVDQMRGEAIDWLICLRDGDVADWEAFTDWLEADPAHSNAYEAVATADADLSFTTADTPFVEAANDDDAAPARRFRRGSWTIGFGALAAALVAVVAAPGLFPAQDRYQVAAAAGEHRVIALADGTQIALNGSSSVTLDHKNMRFAQLDAGEALFSVKHDAAKSFVVTVGDRKVQDVGTVFNVIRRPKGLTVEVSEGEVLVDRQRDAIPLKAGQTLLDTGAGGTAIVGTKDPASIGTWREGRLIYQSATLATVADDLSRNVGVPVSIDPDIAARQFTGVIQVERNPKTLFARLASVLGLDVRPTAKGWKISMHRRAAQ
jgi:transmembrane sensor